MKKIRWWVLGAIVAASATAAVLGPVVRGQPNLTPTQPGAATQPPPPSPVPSTPSPIGAVPPAVPSNPMPATLPGPVGLGMPPVVPGPLPAGQAAKSPGLTAVDLPQTKPAAMPPAPILPAATAAETKPEPAPTPPASKELGGPAEVRLGRQEPSVSIEWVGPPMTRLNQAMNCQLLVRNTCAFPVHNVVVRHRPGAGVACKTSEPQPAVEQGELIWSLGTMAAGQVRRIDLVVVVQIKGPLTCQATVTFSGAASHQVQVSEPQLLVKMKAPDKVLAGEPVTLLFAVSNPGDGAADGVKLKTILPECLEHAHGRAIEVNLGTLAAKEIRTLQLVCTARGSGAHKCLVLATGDGNLSAADEAPLEVLLPKLDLAIAGPKLRYIDRKASYVMKVTNPGSAPAANVVLQGAVPAGFKYHAVSAGGLYDEATRQASWVLGDLQPGQSREVALELVPTAPGDHKLLAQVTSARGLKTDAAARTVVEGLPALLIEVVDTDDPVEVGSETTYEIRVANTGTKTETNVEVVCTLPEQVEFRSAKGGGNDRFCVEGREVIFEPLAKLAPRADSVFRVQVRGKAPGDVRFRVRVRADGLREPVLREESTRFYNDDSTAK